MGYDTIKTEVRDHVGFITFNRPEQLNTFNSALGKSGAELIGKSGVESV